MRYSSTSRSRRPSRSSTSRTQKPGLAEESVSHPHAQAFWKSPLIWLALLGMVTVTALPVIEWYRTVRAIAILGWDVSDSGLADPTIGQKICRAQTQALKPEDIAIDIVYAEATETTRSSKVRSVTQMFPRCESYAKQRPATLGRSPGTSPLLLMERIQTQVQIQRKSGKTNPIAIVVWMDAAEPGWGLPPLNFDVLSQQIKQITDDRAHIAIVGPTGTLRQNLEKLSTQNTRLQVCSISEYQSCIRDTFETARSLPPGN